jgi:hypothetical protein
MHLISRGILMREEKQGKRKLTLERDRTERHGREIDASDIGVKLGT